MPKAKIYRNEEQLAAGSCAKGSHQNDWHSTTVIDLGQTITLDARLLFKTFLDEGARAPWPRLLKALLDQLLAPLNRRPIAANIRFILEFL